MPRSPFARHASLSAPVILSLALFSPLALASPAAPPVPPEQRGSIAAERAGTLDAGQIRTRFTNFGMIGDYPSNPVDVDPSEFHSLEAPKGSGMNYSDGNTPFLLARIPIAGGAPLYVMETGFRERQAFDPLNRAMRLEPRPGYFQADTLVNPLRSPALSDDPRTWPPFWPDKLDDPSGPGWPGRWNGFFEGGRIAAQESYSVMDDQLYSTWPFDPDARDPSRRGMALRYEVRSVQFTSASSRDAMYWYYDVTNEGTTPYDDLVFGVYADVGIGGSGLSCDGVYESDDDGAWWERGATHQMGYAWDRHGHGADLSGTCSPTGYLGWSFVETPGDGSNGADDDLDGLVDERQDGGPGTLLVGPAAIRAYFEAHADTAHFRARHGALEERPAYVAGWWWTGDEDLDWSAADDVGADGVAGTQDEGEGDQLPTPGEPDFDARDLAERDALGLTGFRLNRIRRGDGNVDPHPPDGITFANLSGVDWPRLLHEQFTDPDPADRFDVPAEGDWNLAYLAACGPFSLGVGETVRIGLACVYAPTLEGLRERAAFARSFAEDGFPTTAVAGVEGPAAPGGRAAVLLGAAPNPCAGRSVVRFRLGSPATVTLEVHDLQGRAVGARTSGSFAAGEGRLAFDGSNLAPGLYLYRLRVRDSAGGLLPGSPAGRLFVIE